MSSKGIMLSERSWTEKSTFMYNSRKSKLMFKVDRNRKYFL